MKFSWSGLVCGSACGLVAGVLVAWLLTGCTTTDQERIQDEIDRIKDEVTPTTTTTTTTTTKPPVIPPDTSGDNTFIWKPISESDGRLVVIIPSRLLADACSVTTSAGGVTWGRGIGRHNNKREHFRYPQPGAQYGRNVSVVSYYQGAETGRWTVPDGSQRKTYSTGWRRLMFWRNGVKEDA